MVVPVAQVPVVVLAVTAVPVVVPVVVPVAVPVPQSLREDIPPADLMQQRYKNTPRLRKS